MKYYELNEGLKLPKIVMGCMRISEMDYRELENFLEQHIQQVIPFTAILEQLWYPGKTLKIRLQEKRCLAMHRVRKYVAEDEVLQMYLQDTFDENASRKKRKRIRALPKLLFGRKNYKNRASDR